MRILALQLKRIGDAILTAPALAMLRSAFPDARIELVLHGPSGGLAGAMPGADAVAVWCPGGLNAGLLANIAGGKWDVVLDFTGTDRSVFLAALSRATHRVFYARHLAPGFWAGHIATTAVDASVRDLCTVDFHAALVAGFLREACGLPVPALPPPPCLRLPGSALPEGLPGRFAVLHPGTARDEKYWDAKNWIQVARHVRQTHGIPVVLTGSADGREQAHLAAIRAAPDLGLIDLAGKLSLLESAAVIGRAALVLTVDSAAMHLAGQFGRPQVALFGPTNPFHWAPRHPVARILLGGSGLISPDACRPPAVTEGRMQDIPVDAVLAAVDSLAGEMARVWESAPGSSLWICRHG